MPASGANPPHRKEIFVNTDQILVKALFMVLADLLISWFYRLLTKRGGL